MSITVKFFASLRERIGQSDIKLPYTDSLTVTELWNQVCQGESLPSHILTAINMEYVEQNALVKDGDEVAFFPPVTGG